MAGKKKRENNTLIIKESKWRALLRECADDQCYVTQLAYAAAIRDVEGYGTTRLARIIKKANKYLDELSERRIRPEDLREMIGDETGILLKKSSELE